MGDLIQFRPRPNPKADRAFWIGQAEAEQRVASEALNGDGYQDTATCDYVAPAQDPA